MRIFYVAYDQLVIPYSVLYYVHVQHKTCIRCISKGEVLIPTLANKYSPELLKAIPL